MKKYLNSNLFYQGDANIFLPLCIVYIAAFIFTVIGTNGVFTWNIKYYLYNQSQIGYIFSFEGVVILVAYILAIYAITVGIFKRKKWSTFLSGPFSRFDIRVRELIIIVMSVLIYIGIFLSIIVKNCIQYYDILQYLDGFGKIIIFDVIRIISISTLTIGILALLDSIFANLYYLVGAGILSFIYLVALLVNFNPILSYYSYENVYGLRYIYNGLMQYLGGYSVENTIYPTKIICISVAFVIIGLILIYISRILTNKMFVENMNEGIIFDFPKKVASFMIVTFLGVVSAPYIGEFINDEYFRYTLSAYQIVFVRLTIIVIISIVSYFTFKNFKKVNKDVYY
ncbi:hypothetical protein ACQPVP_04960 [Clostridium nigeriense]|uniref:hypothetical protein n=1 Tax=Clostridium nigeriense TaxID=1805470 RepID=UPI003D32AF74